MDTLLQDLRYALRALRRNPGFTLVAVVTLALGIGANSAIFSVVNAVLLRSLPFAEPERLVQLGTTRQGEAPTAGTVSPPDFMSLREESRAFTDLVAFTSGSATLTGLDEPRRLDAAFVSAGFFELLGAAAVLGRTIDPEENLAGNTDVVVLGYGFWRQTFGGDPSVIGRTLTLNGINRTVIGVAPLGFGYPEQRALWAPLAYDESFSAETAVNRRAQYLQVLGRLRPGVSLEQARTEVSALSARLEQEFAETNTQVVLTMVPLRQVLLGEVRRPLLILLGAVGLVLLIACANVANLLLARATARQSELAVRTALGAARGRLVRQVLSESVLLGLLGGGLGLLLAYGGTALLIALQPEGIPRIEEVGVDGTVAAFTLGVSLLTGLLFGLLPALRAARSSPMGSLRQGGRDGLPGRQGQRTRSFLVVAEMALAVMLLVGAGLLLRSFARLQQVDPGFRPEQTLAVELSLPWQRYPEAAQQVAFYQTLLERLDALPGVSSVGAVLFLPMVNRHFTISFDVRGREPARPGEAETLEVRIATPDYFRTMGIPLQRGRPFTEGDHAEAPQVVLINETTARRFFRGEDPIGQYIQLGLGLDEGRFAGGEVIGIVGDVRQLGPGEDFVPEIYLPHAQVPAGTMSVVLRTTDDPRALVGAIRGEIRTLDPNLSVEGVRSLEQVVSHAVAQPRFYMLLLSLFAIVALTLAAIGIFGVMAYLVAQRTREIGVRIALGASPTAVQQMVVGRALRLALGGIALGGLGALGLTRVMEGLLYGVSTTDPVSFLAVAFLLTGVALLAGYLPARRASRVDPMIALRAQ
jgi:putative ABC transport system permease protein